MFGIISLFRSALLVSTALIGSSNNAYTSDIPHNRRMEDVLLKLDTTIDMDADTISTGMRARGYFNLPDGSFLSDQFSASRILIDRALKRTPGSADWLKPMPTYCHFETGGVVAFDGKCNVTLDFYNQSMIKIVARSNNNEFSVEVNPDGLESNYHQSGSCWVREDERLCLWRDGETHSVSAYDNSFQWPNLPSEGLCYAMNSGTNPDIRRALGVCLSHEARAQRETLADWRSIPESKKAFCAKVGTTSGSYVLMQSCIEQ